jgi:hypothetical protein
MINYEAEKILVDRLVLSRLYNLLGKASIFLDTTLDRVEASNYVYQASWIVYGELNKERFKQMREEQREREERSKMTTGQRLDLLVISIEKLNEQMERPVTIIETHEKILKQHRSILKAHILGKDNEI